MQADRISNALQTDETFILDTTKVRNIVFAGGRMVNIFFKDGSSIYFLFDRFEASTPLESRVI